MLTHGLGAKGGRQGTVMDGAASGLWCLWILVPPVCVQAGGSGRCAWVFFFCVRCECLSTSGVSMKSK